MAIIGFLVLCVLLGKLTLFCGLCMFNNLGQYNIGGVTNSGMKKFWTVIFMLVVAFLWYKLFQHSPFHISMD